MKIISRIVIALIVYIPLFILVNIGIILACFGKEVNGTWIDRWVDAILKYIERKCT